MKTILHTVICKGILALMLMVSFNAMSQTDLAVWTFDILAGNPGTPSSLSANLGPQSGSAYMYLDGTNGSSVWTNNQRDSGNGNALNDPRLPNIPGDAYRLNPTNALGANGKMLVLKFSMTGFENPKLTFACHGTATSFSHQWAYSTDGVSFTNFGTDTKNLAGNWQLRTLDMTALNMLDNATTVYLRVTVSGATNSAGRNRFDNIKLTASEQLPTFGSITQLAAACSGLPSTFAVTGMLPSSTSTITYSVNGGPSANATGVVSDASGNGSFDVILAPADNGQLITVTAIQRTDHPTPVVSVTTGNTASLSVITSVTYYADTDGDSYGDINDYLLSCSGAPVGYVLNSTDCDDGNAAVNPGASETLYDGIDNNCDGSIDEGNQLVTQLKPTQCGMTLNAIYGTISCSVPHPNMTGYRFEVTNLATSQVQTYDSSIYYFQLTNLADYQYGTTYAIRVQMQRLGVWLGYYGPVCTVTTPSLTSGPVALVIPECGTTLQFIQSPIFLTGPNFISSSYIRVTNLTNPLDPNAVQYLTRTAPWFSLKMLASYNYSTTYKIEVQVKTTGAYSAWLGGCNVTTPAAPSITNNTTITSANLKAVSYPNPYTDSFTINLNNDRQEPIEIKIYDMLGNLRATRNVSKSQLDSLRLGSEFIAGVYNVIVSQGEIVQSLRVIKR